MLQISASFVAPGDRATGLDSGADAYLSQPVEPSELLATVRALLRLKRAEQQAQESNELYRVIVQSAPTTPSSRSTSAVTYAPGAAAPSMSWAGRKRK